MVLFPPPARSTTEGASGEEPRKITESASYSQPASRKERMKEGRREEQEARCARALIANAI